MAEQFARNRNTILEGAKVIGGSYKLQNLGFIFKISYLLTDSRILEIEIYIETFSQKYVQVSIRFLDF